MEIKAGLLTLEKMGWRTECSNSCPRCPPEMAFPLAMICHSLVSAVQMPLAWLNRQLLEPFLLQQLYLPVCKVFS